MKRKPVAQQRITLGSVVYPEFQARPALSERLASLAVQIAKLAAEQRAGSA